MSYLVAVGLRVICVKYVLINEISISEIKLSDCNPLLLSINFASCHSDLGVRSSKAIGLSPRSCAAWNKATNDDAVKHQVEFSGIMVALLRNLPIEVRGCAECTLPDHLLCIDMYASHLQQALLKASDSSYIPQRYQHADGNFPRFVGWNDECKQLKDSLFRYKLWVDCSCPRNGVVDIMRTTRRRYHLAVHRLIR